METIDRLSFAQLRHLLPVARFTRHHEVVDSRKRVLSESVRGFWRQFGRKRRRGCPKEGSTLVRNKRDSAGRH